MIYIIGESDAEMEAIEPSETVAALQQKVQDTQAAGSIDADMEFDYVAHLQAQDLQMFFSYHLQQPTSFPKLFNNKHAINHKWVTFNEKNKQSLCCCFWCLTW